MIWGAQFVTPSFAQPTPESMKVLAFARDIRLGLLPDTVVVQPEWITPEDVTVPQVAYMETLLTRLFPGNPCLPLDTPRTDTFSLPRASPNPLSLVNPLIVSPFPGAVNRVAYDAHKNDALGTQRGERFLDWLRAVMIDPLKGIADLTSMDLADAALAQKQGIRTSLFPKYLLHSP